MSTPRINLVVLRSPNIERAVQFYTAFGLTFTKHRHGTGPDHYSTESETLVFELYPLSTPLVQPELLRLGFAVTNLEACLATLLALGASLITPPRASPWGRRAVITDPDGYRIELSETTIHAPLETHT